MGIAFLALIVLQQTPLPPVVWTSFPGRSFIADGFPLLAQSMPWLPLSLAPYDAWPTLLPMLIPVGVMVAMRRKSWVRPSLIVVALVLATVFGVALGVLQVGSSDHRFYLYRFSAFGQPTGFFANSNHMGTLLLVSAPFAVALVTEQLHKRKSRRWRSALIAFGIVGGVILLGALAFNRSLAVLLLSAPIVLATLAIPASGRPAWRKPLLLLSVALFAAVLAAGFLRHSADASKESSFATREEIWSNSVALVKDYGLTGSGLGTYPRLYAHVEPPGPVDLTYVNHAHNDYLELLIELGLPGAVLIAAFFVWWARQTRRAWSTFGNDPYAQAASISSAAILLHSLVDFPLRTAAIAAVFAMCLMLLARRRKPLLAEQEGYLWPTRQLTVDQIARP
jgi:O-antigen ligase